MSAAAPGHARPLARALGAATLGLTLGTLLLGRTSAPARSARGRRGPRPQPQPRRRDEEDADKSGVAPVAVPARTAASPRADAHADAKTASAGGHASVPFARDGGTGRADIGMAAPQARRLYEAAALLAASVLSDSALEHYRGGFENPGMFAPLASAAVVLACALHGARRTRAEPTRPLPGSMASSSHTLPSSLPSSSPRRRGPKSCAQDDNAYDLGLRLRGGDGAGAPRGDGAGVRGGDGARVRERAGAGMREHAGTSLRRGDDMGRRRGDGGETSRVRTSMPDHAAGPATNTLLAVPFATACAVGTAGLGFHAYNVLRRPGGLSWGNLFYAAPLGAPAALALAGVIGLAARPVARGAPRLAGLPGGRALCALAAFGIAGTSAEAALLHFRGAFQHPAMWLPVSVPPAAALLLARAAVSDSPRPPRLAHLLLRACTWLGVIGTGFHTRGVARQMGGWRNWSQNLLAGPPLPAPPSFSALALAGRAALALRAAQAGSVAEVA